MTDTADLIRQIIQIEALISSPASKGKLTALKASHRKLCSAYRRARSANERERMSQYADRSFT